MYKINASSTIRVPVAGTIAGEEGKPVKFTFGLQCKRLNQPEIEEMLKDGSAPVDNFFQQVTTGWHDVVGDDDQPVEFTEENFGTLLNQPGMRQACFNAYMVELAVKPKN